MRLFDRIIHAIYDLANLLGEFFLKISHFDARSIYFNGAFSRRWVDPEFVVIYNELDRSNCCSARA